MPKIGKFARHNDYIVILIFQELYIIILLYNYLKGLNCMNKSDNNNSLESIYSVAIQEYCIKYKIDRRYIHDKMGSYEFDSILVFIRDNYLFKNGNNSKIFDSRLNKFLMNDVLKLVNDYFELTRLFNKIPSIDSFSLFSGISANTINAWSRSNDANRVECYKLLHNSFEKYIIYKLIDSNNPTGAISVCNNVLGWNKARAEIDTIAISSAKERQNKIFGKQSTIEPVDSKTQNNPVSSADK